MVYLDRSVRVSVRSLFGDVAVAEPSKLLNEIKEYVDVCEQIGRYNKDYLRKNTK